MKIAALGNPGSWYCLDIQRAVEEQGHEFQRLDFATLCAAVGGRFRERFQAADQRLKALDALVVRTMAPGSLEQVVFRMDTLGQLASAGTLVVNSPKSIECAVDKYLTTARLHAAGVPVPETAVCEGVDEAMAWFEELGGDTVVKPVFGAEGRGIVRISDPDLAWRTFRTLERLNAVIYQQRFIPNDGSDIRVLLLGGEVIGAIRRKATSGFRTNVAQQGTASSYTPTLPEIQLALRSAESVGADFAGIDLMYDGSSCLVLEVNAVPGWRAFRRVTGIDVAHRLVSWIERHLLVRRS